MRIFNLPKRFKILAHHSQRNLKSALHPQAAEIEKRIAIISFFDNHGPKTTKEAYSISRSTVYNWKRTLTLSGGKTASLAPGSTAPAHKRTRLIDQRICAFITSYRAAHPRVGQQTILPHLTAFCKNNSLSPVSAATIGRIIADLKRAGKICDNPARNYLNIRTGAVRCPGPKKKSKKIRRNGYLPQTPGDLVQVDSVTVFTEGLKRYIVTAIDLKTRFAFACAYPTLSSLSAKDFMEKFRKAAPFEVKRVQTDNGQEFEKYFRDYAVQNNIVQFFNYPRSPKSNAHIERFNRTIQEQHVEWHLEELREPRELNLGLMEYLIWYNTEKPHQGIGYRTPMRCVLDDLAPDPEKSNMLRDSTGTGRTAKNPIYY